MIDKESNGFNFLRLLFASFVIVTHSYSLLEFHGRNSPLSSITGHQIGLSSLAVNAFFAISGFLIFRSLHSSRGLLIYLRKRALRIFPGFWVAIIVSIVAIGWFEKRDLFFFFEASTLHYWLNTSLLNIKFTIPGIFESHVRQGINGSLWTIPYEFFLYLAILPFYWIRDRKVVISTLVFLIVCGHVLYFVKPLASFGLFSLSFYKLIYTGLFFLFGCLCNYFLDFIGVQHKKIFFLSSLVFVLSLVFRVYEYVQFLALPMMVISLGFFSFRKINKAIKADYSYGVYLYAFPVQQLIISQLAISNPLLISLYAFIISLILAFFSWNLIEKRALLYK